ncbi:binding-protein-dependent transport system inner membrane protein [Thermincola ferriacetica]|uniref:Binding-protein-dependent transport system inner membrane protein n=1 Tax=Thermincola ferriacetica TaxID=281456 RepID=A0A0L6W1S9_9FIRM|nr:nickel transporter permease [Thermincola ferriacetica]KNZ69034.1 binding-protein-dependent transport system inner membrane protein [Thermincola ferriacetica]
MSGSTTLEIKRNRLQPRNGKRESKGLWGDVFKRLIRSKSALTGLILVAVFLLVALCAPLIAPYDPITDSDLVKRLEAPSSEHIMGRDSQGRDIFSRIIYGARISVQIGVISVSFSLVLGVVLGAIAGFYGKWLDGLIMRLMDILLAFPSVLLAIAITAVLGPELRNAMIAIGVVYTPHFARIVRSTVLSVKTTEYIEAARAIGCSDLRIILRHVLPNCMAPIIVQTTLSIGTAILDAAALSFLGLGAQPPTPEWGAMLSDGRSYIQRAPHVMIFPGMAIMFVVLGFNLLGDGLRDALDPRLKR